MIKPKILITRRWPEFVEAELMRRYDVQLNETDMPLTVSQLCDALGEYDAILPTVTDVLTAQTFDRDFVRTKAICNYGVGVSHIDLDRAKSLGITVTNTPDVLSECTADIALTLMLMTARRAGEGEREIRADAWTGWRPTHSLGTKVTGKTIGIVGFGRIGQECAKRAHFGFGMNVIVFNRSPIRQEILNQFNANQSTSLMDVFAASDFVSIHCPGGDANRHLINSEILAKSKPGLILINTARGEVVDELAMADALGTGVLGGAGLDVFDGEPNIRAELLDAPNTVLLPHLGSATLETRVEMGQRVVENLDAIFAEKLPRDLVM